jgi:hypothetical protein
MWDKFVDRRASSPWIPSGQLSEFSAFSAALWWGSRLSLANSQGGAGDAKAPPTQNKPVGDHRACLPAFLLTPSPITLFTIEFFLAFSSSHVAPQAWSGTFCHLQVTSRDARDPT